MDTTEVSDSMPVQQASLPCQSARKSITLLYQVFGKNLFFLLNNLVACTNRLIERRGVIKNLKKYREGPMKNNLAIRGKIGGDEGRLDNLNLL
jgi:hypothetical protein